jgi:hypothetical protein
MRVSRRDFVVAAGACAVTGWVVGSARSAQRPPVGTVTYRVLRDGAEAGRHVMTVSRTGSQLVVTNDIAIAVGLLGITVYRYEHVSTERWDGERLVALDSRTNKNGRKKRLEGRRSGERLVLTNQDGEHRSFRDSPITTALWHPRTPHQDTLLEIEDGWMKRLESRDLGRDEVPVGGRTLPAQRFRLGGEIGRDVWYDDAGRLVRVAFDSGKDGSRIVVAAERLDAAA